MKQTKAFAAVIFVLVLALCVPTVPSHAGSRDAAIAAGIIGAVGTAIILHGMSKPARAYEPKKARTNRAPSHKPAGEKEAVSRKDPFAASAAPAGYATPVADK